MGSSRPRSHRPTCRAREARRALAGLAACALVACGGPPTLDAGGPDAPALDAGSAQQPIEPSLCDPVSRLGCSGDRRCTWIRDGESGGATGCAPRGALEERASCAIPDEGVDECANGMLCAAHGCTRICDIAETPSSACVCIQGGAFADRADVGLCFPACDPLAPACPSALGCYYASRAARGVCLPAGDLGQGAPCGYLNDCGAGLGCSIPAPDRSTLTCARFCDVGTPECGAGFTCYALSDIVDGVTDARLGVCIDCALYPGVCASP